MRLVTAGGPTGLVSGTEGLRMDHWPIWTIELFAGTIAWGLDMEAVAGDREREKEKENL